jgi:hypothetical protein
MKQLIDLLDQVAVASRADAAARPGDEEQGDERAPKDRDVASTARAAIDALRRGVIAYSALAD